jgi:hypothetical protein
MSENETRWLLHFLAEKSKSLYRENLAHRAFAQYLKDQGYQGVDEILNDARNSPEVESIASAFSQAIDAKMPSILEGDENQALVEWIQGSGLDQGTSH